MGTLIPVADRYRLDEAGISLKQSTLRKWHCLGRHAELFVKLARRLHVDSDAWNALVKEAMAERDVRVASLARMRRGV